MSVSLERRKTGTPTDGETNASTASSASLLIVKILESLSHTFIIASYLETVMRCVESQMSILSRMRLIVNECEMFESQHTLIGLDFTLLTN